MNSPYSDKVIQYFQNPKNVGDIEDPDGVAKEGSPACGDMVQLHLKVDKKTQLIEDIKFRSYGCASNIATGSIITEMAKGSSIDEAKEITWQQAADELGGLPAVKNHCSVLAVDALKEAIRDYEEKNGLIKEQLPTTIEVVKERLKHVMNPIHGLDVLHTNLISKIEIDDNIIIIDVDLDEDHQFAPVVKEDILEKLEHRWDIEKVKVSFQK
ncbi:MAG: iron-sulfur cluster assembly scaffold protein [Halanaerobiales bacterium]|nr:iron-sulfur cluster assembly scaffold protein [Halanaerobiales bacterium]